MGTRMTKSTSQGYCEHQMKGKYLAAGIAPGTSQAFKLSSLPSPSPRLLTVVAKVQGSAYESMTEA